MSPAQPPYDRLPEVLRPMWAATLARQRGWSLGCGGLAALAGFAFAGYLAWYVLRRASHYDGAISIRMEELIPGVIAVLVALGGAAVFASAVLPGSGDVLKQPSRVVWVYKSLTGFYTEAVIAMESGAVARIGYMIAKRPDLYSADEKRIEEQILGGLERAYPGAEVGFTRERRQRFASDPKSLGVTTGSVPNVLVKSGIPPWMGAAIAAAPPPSQEMFLVAKPTCTFTELERCMATCGLPLAGQPALAAGAPEPVSAIWLNDAARVDYTFFPETRLRLLHIRGPRAEYVRNDILNLAYLPTLETQIPDLLASSVVTEVLLGLGAAGFLGRGGRGHYYVQRAEALRAHPDAAVRAAAESALRFLRKPV